MITVTPENYDAVIGDVINKVSGDETYVSDGVAEAFQLVRALYLKEPFKEIPDKEDEIQRIPYFAFIIETARIIAFDMRGSYAEVVLSVLAPALARKLISIGKLNKFNRYITNSLRKLTDVVEREALARKLRRDDIDGIVMNLVYEYAADRLMEDIRSRTAMSRIPDSYLINKAYELAKVAHQGQYRESGGPYIIHPLLVAETLANAGVESNVISAALLHDVVEDSGLTIADIENSTNVYVARLVNAVTSIDEEFDNIIDADPDAPEASFDKKDRDQETVRKLIRVVSDDSMIFALYIKAADRMHNLRTIAGMSSKKIEAKIRETQQYYLPVFRNYKLNIFIPEIEDLCWKMSGTSSKQHELYESVYRKVLRENYGAAQETCDALRGALSNIPAEYYSQLNCAHFRTDFKKREYTALEVHEMLIKDSGIDHEISALSLKYKIPLFDFNIILYNRDNELDALSFIPVFMEKYREELAGKDLVIVDYGIKRLERYDYVSFFVDLQDRFSNIIRVRFYTLAVYNSWMHGTFTGFIDESEHITDADSISVNSPDEVIVVKKRNGESMTLVKGSTVLDFAFAIHQDVGLTLRAAKVNKQPTDIFKPLNNGDEVVVIADSGSGDGESRQMVFHARIDWLLHVETDRAKRKLVRYLQYKYKENDPGKVYNAMTGVVASVSAGVYDRIADKMSSITNE